MFFRVTIGTTDKIQTEKAIVISIAFVLTIVIDMIILLFTKEYMTAIICISLITSIHVLRQCKMVGATWK